MGVSNSQRKKLSPVSYLLIICLLANVFVVLINPNQKSNIKEVKAATGNLHLFWTGANAPSGWTIVSDGLGEPFFGRFIKGAASYGGTGGSAIHTHTVTTTVNATGSIGRDTSASDTHSTLAHSHSSNTNVSSPSHLPPYRQIKVIEYGSGVPDTIPAGAVAIFDSAPPSGWTTLTNYNSKFLRCLDDATSTGGATTHTHTVTTSLGYSIQARVAPNGRINTSMSRYDHTHTLASSYTTSSESNLPVYIDVILASKDSDGAAPIDMIGFFDDALSYGWSSVSGNGGAFDGKYIRGNSSYGGTGGSNTHSHDDSGYQTTTDGSTFDGTALDGTYGGAFGNHTHAVTFTNFQTVSNEPPYIEVIFAKRTAVYQPEINNWRWYADEKDETPGTAYAAENTTTPSVEMGKSIGFKLRINFTEVEGVAGNNSRKKLQYATSTSGPWTDVGATSYTGALFRYYDGGGSDNGTLDSTLITGSSSTSKGIHNESNSAAPSNSDHPASTTVEFEYCIENYNAAANTLYYFGFEDETSGEIPIASGKSHPSLTTASVYDLSMTSPSSVYFGSWKLGSSADYKYTFGVGEEIEMRDNRGQTLGSSSGWTCSVEVTTDLTYVITPPSVDPASFTGSGVDDMSSGGTYSGSSDLDYKVEIDSHYDASASFTNAGGIVNVLSTGHGITLHSGITVFVQGSTDYDGTYTEGSGLNYIDADNFTLDTLYQGTPRTGTVEYIPNTFKWSDDGGSTWDAEDVAMTGLAQTLNNGVTVTFGATTGHAKGDYWEFTAHAGEVNTITSSQMEWTTNAITGYYDAPTTGMTGSTDENMGSGAVTAVEAVGSGKQGLGGFYILPSIKITGVTKIGDYTGGVLTFTIL